MSGGWWCARAAGRNKRSLKGFSHRRLAIRRKDKTAINEALKHERIGSDF